MECGWHHAVPRSRREGDAQSLARDESIRSTLEWRSAERLTTPAGQDVAATLSRDGTRIAFSQQQETSRIWAFPIDTTGRPRVVGEGRPLTEEGAMACVSALSPDGVKLAYELWRPGTDRSELWVRTSTAGRASSSRPMPKGPVWSRDGTSVAYATSAETNNRSSRRPLTGRWAAWSDSSHPWSSEVMFGPAAWTPGTARSARSCHRFRLGGADVDRAVARLEPEGGAAGAHSPVVPRRCPVLGTGRSPPTVVGFSLRCCDSTDQHRARWSPRLRGASSRHGSVSRRTTNRLTSRGGSADGKTIFFISKGSTSHLNLWAARFDPERGQPVGEPFALTHFDSSTMVISPYIDSSELGISARHAALTMLTVTGSIWMLENVDR